MTESLDYVPGRFKVVRHVREAFACRACEQVVQARLPTMRFPRAGWSRGSWPTSRWRSSTTIFRCIARPRSTRATASIWRPRRSRAGSARLRPTLQPLTELLRREVIGASDVLHGDDTPIPVLAPARARRARAAGTYVRDERPHGGARPPAPCSSPRPTVEASARSRTWRPSPVCWWPTAMPASTGCTSRASGRRPDRGGVLGARAPQDLRRARRDGLGSRGGGAGADRGALRGRARPVRQAARCPHPRAADPLEAAGRGAEGLDRTSLAQVPGRSDLAKALRYMLARWPALMRAFDDGRLASTTTRPRALRCVAVGRKNYLFAGSELGAERAAAFYT